MRKQTSCVPEQKTENRSGKNTIKLAILSDPINYWSLQAAFLPLLRGKQFLVRLEEGQSMLTHSGLNPRC